MSEEILSTIKMDNGKVTGKLEYTIPKKGSTFGANCESVSPLSLLGIWCHAPTINCGDFKIAEFARITGNMPERKVKCSRSGRGAMLYEFFQLPE